MKKSLIITICLFVICNTLYFWEGKLGFIMFPLTFVLIFLFLGLVIKCVISIIQLIKSKFINKRLLIRTIIIVLLLIITFLFPYGIIPYYNYENNLLVAGNEGGGNCATTIKLRKNNFMLVRNVCFGITETKGKYQIQNDTIIFETKNLRWKYGIYNHKKNILECYQNLTDSIPYYPMQVFENKLFK